MEFAKKPLYKFVVSGLLALALVLVLPAFTVRADDGEEEEVTPNGGPTTATIEFTQGELVLMDVPTLDFGTWSISDTTAYAATADGLLHVADHRGTGDGWRLSVALSAFENSGSTSLEDASIVVNGATVAPLSDNNASPAAECAGATMTIACDNNSVYVFRADSDKGLGAWTSTWVNTTTVLNIMPGTATQGIHEATLTWSLEDTPTSGG